MNMNSRERVRAVINHRIPDRIPCGLGGCETAGLHVAAYDRLQKLLGVERIPPRMDTFMCNAVFEQEVLQAMGGDILLVSSPMMCKSPLWGNGFEQQWKEQTLWGKSFRVSIRDQFRTETDGTMIWESQGGQICPPGAFFFDSAEPTDLTAEFEIPSPDTYHPPHQLSDSLLRNLEETAKALYETTAYSLCMGETITDLQIAPGGMVGSMVLMMEEPDMMKEYLEKSLEAGLAQLVQLDQAVGKYVDILSIAHDFGDNRGVTIGPQLWREIYKPYYHRLFHQWHRITAMKANLHSCGSTEAILGDLAECGMDIYNPVQTSAFGMDPKGLKERFGKDLVFFGGGYDAQKNPQADSYEQVYHRVSENILALGKDGGYLFAGVHNLPADTPQEHLRAMLDAWRDHREYPIVH